MIGPDVVRILDAGHAPPPGLPSLNLRQNIDWTERETVRRAIESASGVKKDAAEAMGISQRALSYYRPSTASSDYVCVIARRCT